MDFADRFVAVDGRRVAYVDEGPRGGVPLLLLHGGGFDHAEMTWAPTVAALRGRLRMVVPDLPGYGSSAAPERPQDLAALGRWTAAFLDAVGIAEADVAGVSMGGGMALWLGIHRPERVRRLVPVSAYGILGRLPFHRWRAFLPGPAPLRWSTASPRRTGCWRAGDWARPMPIRVASAPRR